MCLACLGVFRVIFFFVFSYLYTCFLFVLCVCCGFMCFVFLVGVCCGFVGVLRFLVCFFYVAVLFCGCFRYLVWLCFCFSCVFVSISRFYSAAPRSGVCQSRRLPWMF